MKSGTFAGAAGFLLGIGMSAAVSGTYGLDDVYRMALLGGIEPSTTALKGRCPDR